MKRLILITAVAVLTTGCASIFLSPSDIANRVELGMTVAEFKRLAGSYAQLDALRADGSVYRIDKHNIGIPDYVVSTTLFHFNADGRLVEVETRDSNSPFFPGISDFEPLTP
jgi:PBP1b-binding outer membrane lipoprotein LpoB